MPHHARATMWTINHSHRWFARCDQCGRWRLFGWYYELYPPLRSKGSAAGWWWACGDCLVDIISDRLFPEPKMFKGPTVGEMLTDAQRFREQLEADGLYE